MNNKTSERITSIVHIVVGCVIGAVGSYCWIQFDKKTLLDQFLISLLVTVAGLNFFFGLKGLFVDGQTREEAPITTTPKWYSKEGAWALFLIYMGAVFYALAAFYHLALPKWTFLSALAVAVPLILIEYHFSIRGNRMVYEVLKWNATQVAFVTLIFYFINTWILNKFVFKRSFVVWREIVAFCLLAGAFVVLQWGS